MAACQYSLLDAVCWVKPAGDSDEKLNRIAVSAFLTMIEGSRVGEKFLLESSGENRVGRGMECHIVLTDPLCSRIHAVVYVEDDLWFVRDAHSRNGTFLDDKRIEEERLTHGSLIRVGSTSFTFQESAGGPSMGAEAHVTQTIVLDTSMGVPESSELALNPFREPERTKDLLLLHQLAIKLLGCKTPDEVVHHTLRLLFENTGASLAGFLWLTDRGELRPKTVIPEEQQTRANLSRYLTEKVCRDQVAVWVDNQTAASGTESLSHFADAICVPLIREEKLLGALHLYTDRGRFEQRSYDLAIGVANICAIALATVRQLVTLKANHQRLVDKSGIFDELIGQSPPMLDLKAKIDRVAKAHGCALIRGESGCGKELVARALHRASSRSDRPILSVNCAAIPPHLMESQLFGHKKGAFTGAEGDHDGWFQQADSGTLFLDEVGEMTLDGQAKLLRVLEGHPFLPVGAAKEVNVDVRVIAATNRELAQFVAEKRFREDLFYRLNVFELYIPPLRERGSDIGLLIDFFLDHFRKQNGRPGLNLADAARRVLLEYPWPGNVRQLRNVIDSATVMADGEWIEPKDLQLRDAGVRPQSGNLMESLQNLRVDHWQENLIQEALRRSEGRVEEAAKLLNMKRATLYRWIKKNKDEP